MKINSKFTRIMGVGLSTAMLATTVLTAVPAFADVSAVTATPNNTGISQNANWDIRFTATNLIDASNQGNITITFPSGFTVNNSGTTGANTTGFTIAAGPGWINDTSFGDAILATPTANGTSATKKVFVKLGAGDVIGAGAQVRIILPPGVVTNPSTAGTYNITVATSNDTAAITSNNIIITLPSLGPLPGQVEGKNSNGDVLYRNIVADLTAVMNTPGVSRIELSSGTYNFTNAATTINQTIIGVGPAGTVILTAGAAATPLTVGFAGMVIQNLVISGNPANTAPDVIVSENVTLRNVSFLGGNTQLSVSGTPSVIVDNCTFAVTGNVSTGIVGVNSVTISNSTFTVDGSGTGISTTGNLTVTNSVFNGSSTSTGVNIGTGAGASTNNTNVNNNTFSGLRQAVVVGNEAVAIRNNTFNANGDNTQGYARGAAVTSAAGAQLLLMNNTISNSAANNYALVVAGGNVTVRFNNITGNTLNVLQSGTGNVSATLNWWGSSTGPSAASINASDSTLLDTTPFLTGSVSNGVAAFVPTANLTAKDTAGVDVSTSNGTMAYASAAKYAANPQATAPTGTPIAYYDVALGVTTGQEPGSITIRFYGAVTASTKVYYGGGLSGAWSLAETQGVNTASGFAFVTITGTSSPAFSDMGGTPFALSNTVNAPVAPALVGPTGTSVPLNTGFSWAPVTGADTYNFQVSTASNFATTVASQTGLTATVAGGVTLTSNTTYFWRVQAVNVGGTSAWATGTFTTNVPASSVSAPPAVTVNVTPTAPVVNVAPAQVTVQPPNVTVNPPTVNVAAPAAPNVTVNPPQVTITPPPPAQVNVTNTPAGPVIPTYILWTIILIGAVLVIALIVLIVRTRRVA